MNYVDLTDAQDLAWWLDRLQNAVDDLESAAADQLRPPGKRRLGRASALQIVNEAGWTIAQLIDAARGPTGHADPSGLGGSNDVN